jgi:hypothetical protein
MERGRGLATRWTNKRDGKAIMETDKNEIKI